MIDRCLFAQDEALLLRVSDDVVCVYSGPHEKYCTITTVLPVVLVVLLVVRTITITTVLLVVLVVLLVVIVVGADPPGHLVGGLVALLPGLGVTDLSGDLPLEVLGHLVALPLHVLLADGGGPVASGLS